MRKSKSWEKMKAQLKAPPRLFARFDISADSHPSKVARWLGRGGGSPIARSPEQMRRAHIHPRSLRARPHQIAAE